MAYFSNFILIAALLGLGIGMIIASRRGRGLHRFPFGLVVLIVAVVLLERSGLVFPLAAENNFLWNGLSRSASNGPFAYAALVTFFALTCLVFVPLGQEVGHQLERFTPITGYSINILGSLMGVVGVALVSYFRWPPMVWFGCGSAIFVAYLLTAWPGTRAWVVAMGLILMSGTAVVAVAHRAAEGEYSWSPYYEIRTEDLRLPSGENVGFNLVVNQDSHQQALDLGDGRPASDFLDARRQLYDLPYTLSQPKSVLILGAGSGNDVAAALRAGAERVDAVEIDPVIADIGKQHPERPYEDPRVHLHVADARSFLERDARTYDLIVFGFLDSHRLFSSMSSVRLDNYIYTRENMQNVRRHLSDDGLLALTFTVHEKWIADRLFALLADVYGHEATVYQGNAMAWGTTFLARNHGSVEPSGPVISPDEFASQILPSAQEHTWAYADRGGFLDNGIFDEHAVVPTDDWPHLYMKSRSIPFNYAVVLVLTFALALVLVRFSVRATGLSQFENWNFFFLGVAFALLETKGITDIALLFGSTWITNSVVIASVLLMILFANVIVQRVRRLPLAPVYALLAASLIFNYLFAFQGLLHLDYGARLLLAGLQVSLPMFFAGIIFAAHFSKVREPSAALGANLIGAMGGGLLEYTSLLLGQQMLFLAALAFYALSLAVVVATSRARTGLLVPWPFAARKAA